MKLTDITANLKQLLELKLISLRKLGSLIYPDIPATQAGAKLHMKVYEKQGNRLTEEDLKKIKNILK